MTLREYDTLAGPVWVEEDHGIVTGDFGAILGGIEKCWNRIAGGPVTVSFIRPRVIVEPLPNNAKDLA